MSPMDKTFVDAEKKRVSGETLQLDAVSLEASADFGPLSFSLKEFMTI